MQLNIVFDIFTILVTEIITQPVSSLTVIALEDATLTCLASVDDATYSWHRVNDSIPLRSKGKKRKTLTIPKATPPDEGMYYCVATKEGISVKSNRAVVKVDGEKINFVIV